MYKFHYNNSISCLISPFRCFPCCDRHTILIVLLNSFKIVLTRHSAEIGLIFPNLTLFLCFQICHFYSSITQFKKWVFVKLFCDGPNRTFSTFNLIFVVKIMLSLLLQRSCDYTLCFVLLYSVLYALSPTMCLWP
mgnify:CR=1 FL=1